MKCFVIGKARDGTTTLRNLFVDYIKNNFKDPIAAYCERFKDPGEFGDRVSNGSSGSPYPQVGYVSKNEELWPEIIRYIEKNEQSGLETILDSLTADIEITHGFGFILPVVATIFGRDIKLIIIHRKHESHLRSLVARLKVDPQRWKPYGKQEGHIVKNSIIRPSAVNYGEITNAGWEKMSASQQFDWFITKQKVLISKNRNLFSNVLDVNTEELGKPETLKNIFNFVYEETCGTIPEGQHVHSTFNIDAPLATPNTMKRVETFWEQVNFNKFLSDDKYAMEIYCQDLIARVPEKQNVVQTFFKNLKSE
tara:strand:+ start:1311 stop:2237 length:927 start_codon:yes stop_codon:yes gene_type:complete